MSQKHPSRRSFLKSSASSAAALAASGSLSALRAATPVHQDPVSLKVGIVGVGGRGSGAAVQAILADKGNVLHAAGDAFADRLENGLDAVLETVTERGRERQFDVPAERRFVGLDAVDQVLAAGVDVVLLATPPGFRPMQIEKAVAKGVHVFAQKPVGICVPATEEHGHAANRIVRHRGEIARTRRGRRGHRDPHRIA
jgi:hypothetical protein